MNKSSVTLHEKARKTEALIRNGIQDVGRKQAMAVLDVSDSTMAKFVAGDKPDCKINVKSISKLLIKMGLKVVPLDSKIAKKGEIAIPLQIAVSAWHNSDLGMKDLRQKLEAEGGKFYDDDD